MYVIAFCMIPMYQVMTPSFLLRWFGHRAGGVVIVVTDQSRNVADLHVRLNPCRSILHGPPPVLYLAIAFVCAIGLFWQDPTTKHSRRKPNPPMPKRERPR